MPVLKRIISGFEILLALSQKESSLKYLLRAFFDDKYTVLNFRRPVLPAKWNGGENLIEFNQKQRTFNGSDKIPSIEM